MSDYFTKFMTADDDVYDCIGKRLKLEGRRRERREGLRRRTVSEQCHLRREACTFHIGFLLLSSAWLVQKDS